MQSTKDKQQLTLDMLIILIKKYLQQTISNNPMNTSQQIKITYIDEFIKKLQKNIYQTINCCYPPEDISQKNWEHQELKIMELIDILIKPICQQDKFICLEWIISIVKINIKTQKSESIYQLAKQANQEIVIALPYDVPGPIALSTATVTSPDCVAQQQHVQQKKYFQEDEEIVTIYFETPFYTIRRQGISQFATKLVQHICRQLIQPFLKNPVSSHCLQTYIKFTDLLTAISTPIYTYFLISCFKKILEKLNQFMMQIKINTSINSDKINRLMYNLTTISNRWEGSVYYSKTWQWQIKSKTILGMLMSNVSQTKLTAVKMLIQFCRKVEYSSYKPEDIQKYIKKNSILDLIFSPDNHPEVISKGKQVCQFLCKYDILEERQIDILLNLIDKSHQNVSKSIYITIQSLGQNNLTVYHRKVISRIQQLSRASFFTDQTLQLLQTLLVIAPGSQIKDNMGSIYNIIKKHYSKLRKHLRQKLVRLYFELFIMGAQEGIFVQEDKTNVIIPIADNLGTNLSALLLDSFIKVIKNQAGKNIVGQCKQILKQSIAALFKKYKIHKVQIKTQGNSHDNIKINPKNYKQLLVSNPLFYSKQVHYGLVKYLLQTYQGQEIPISYQDLCDLIEKDISFTKFIQYYNKKQQIQVIQTMLTHPNKGFQHLSNIVQVYSLICSDAKQEVSNKIRNWFFQSKQFQQKIRLGQFIVNNTNQQQKIDEVCSNIVDFSNPKSEVDQMKLFSYLILLKYIVSKQDKKGFGQHLPFSYSSNSYDVLVKVTNSIDVLKPAIYQLQSQSYETLSEVISKILKHDNLTISGVNFKINEKYMSIGDLQSKIGQIAKKICKSQNTNTNQFKYEISVIVFDVYETQWFDKSQLISHGILNTQVIVALTQIFTKYTITGKMHRAQCTKVFQIATQTERISVNDSRIQHLYSLYSNNGQYLTLEQWLNFYQKSSQDNPGTVIENLRKLGYRYLFKNQNQLLQQYHTIQPNYIRDYLFDNGASVYSALLQKYINHYLNNYCQELLKLLPLHKKFIIEAEQKQMVQQGKQHQRPKIAININYLIQGLNNIDLNNNRQLWYSLALLNEVCSSADAHQKSYQNQKVISCLLKILYYQIQKLEQFTSLDQQQIQLVGYLTKMVKMYYASKMPINFITTLIDQKKKIQSQIQPQDKIQDPLTAIKISQNLSVIKPQINFHSINKFAQCIFTCQQNVSNLETKSQIIKLIDQLLCIYVQSPKQILCQDTQISIQLIFNTRMQIRSIYNNLYYLLCEINSGIKTQYYAINLQQISEMLKKKKRNNRQDRYHEFFKTFNKMLILQTDQNQNNVYFQVSTQIQKAILQHIHSTQNQMDVSTKCLAITNDQKYQDNILLGQLTILDTIKVYVPDLQIQNPQQWLNKLLLYSHCSQTLSILYRMSHKLCSIQFNLKNISNIMVGLTIHKNSQIRKINRMGLFNLGCICYVNSTLQQLFMIQPFRNAIISAYIEQCDPGNYFYQFQYMIYQLEYGKRQFFIPDNFCLTYTDFQNKPIDIKQQHDADQFLNSLLDRLQKTLNSTDKLPQPVTHLIRNNFCGQLANIITCQSCYNYNVKIQDFYILTLEIKNNKNLIQCFQKLTQPQSITDYYCDQCQKKVQLIQKQLRIKKLPKFLFIHLQRLVFDLDTLSKIKLQHLVDYPEELDLLEFFNHQLCDQDRVKYKLKGFVVHIGTSQSGHYYSLVKQNGKWIKFDDSRVEEWKWENNSKEKQGTYLLIYERVQENNQEIQLMREHRQQISIGNAQIFQKVKQDNQMLIRQTIFLQKPFGRHLINTLSRIQIPYELLNSSPNQIQVPFHPDHRLVQPKNKLLYIQAHDIILKYLNLVSQSKSLTAYEYNPDQIKNITCYLILLLHINPELIQRTVQKLLKCKEQGKIKTQIIRRVLTHSDKTIRQAYKLIFTKVLSILTSITQQVYHSYFMPSPPETQLWFIQKILQYFLGSLYDAAKNYSKMQQHFQLLGLVIQMSNKACLWFQQQCLGPKLIHFISGEDTALKNQLASYNYQNQKKSDAINTITKIISQMIKVYLKKTKHQILDTNCIQYKAFFTIKWYSKLYEGRYNFQYVNQAVGELVARDNTISAQICELIVEKINRFSHTDEYILTYVHLLQIILRIDDQLSKQRCQYILGVPRLFIETEDIITVDNTRYYKYWSNQLTNTDQFILPLLELLYTNRQQTNYFTLSAITSILNMIIKCKHIEKYMLELPAPLGYNYYTDWINIVLKNGLKQDIVLSRFDKKVVINEIAGLLNIVEQRLTIWEPTHQIYIENIIKNNKQMQQQQQIQNIGIQQQKLSIQKNKTNNYYTLKGSIKQVNNFTILPQQQELYSVKGSILEDENKQQIIKFQFSISPQVNTARIYFTQTNYEYSFIVNCKEFQLVSPIPNEFICSQIIPASQLFVFVVTAFVEKPIQHLNSVNNKQHNVNNNNFNQEEKTDNNNAMMQQEESVIVMDGDSNHNHNNNNQIFECPFCTSISYNFSSRCPVCGQQWGQMM